MSVSEWTEGLKKKEASLIYVNPSVGFADSSQCGEPFGVPYKLLYSLGGPPMTAPTTHLINFWHKQGDALRPHIFTISHDHPPIGGFHMAEQYFTAHGRNFTAGVSPLFSRLRAVHVRIFAV